MSESQNQYGERTLALEHLEWSRQLIIETCSHLTEEQARLQLVASKTTPAGIIRHLIAVEQFWFRYIMTGGVPADDWIDDPDDDPEWNVEGLSLQALLAQYRETIRESNMLISNVDFDAVSKRESHRGLVNLRWIVLHMIHENAQHCGHMDILVEQISSK
jgi:uncharacterized damage-inducible protein DinB